MKSLKQWFKAKRRTQQERALRRRLIELNHFAEELAVERARAEKALSALMIEQLGPRVWYAPHQADRKFQ